MLKDNDNIDSLEAFSTAMSMLGFVMKQINELCVSFYWNNYLFCDLYVDIILDNAILKESYYTNYYQYYIGHEFHRKVNGKLVLELKSNEDYGFYFNKDCDENVCFNKKERVFIKTFADLKNIVTEWLDKMRSLIAQLEKKEIQLEKKC